jgi:hypothetical protein
MPHAHPHVYENACNSSSYGGVGMNPYYPFPSPPPMVMIPPITIPQALFG